MSATPALTRWRTAGAGAAKTALLRCGFFSALRRLKPSRQVAILRYHAICGPEGYAYADPGICVSPAAFAQHAAYLAAHYDVLPLPEVVRTMRAGSTLPPNAVAITFDDGYTDNLEAARVLQRHGLTATFYLTAGCLGGETAFWPAELRELVSAIPGPAFRIRAGGDELTLANATAEQRHRAIRRLSRLFKSNPIRLREEVRAQLRRLAGDPAIPGAILSWENVAEMSRLGMTIGAHTLTHPNLPSAGPEDARSEIAGSKSRLEAKLGISVTMFSYPNGGAERYVTPQVRQLVQDAGYEAATTSTNGFASRSSDLFGLERVQVAERLEDLVFALEVERFAFAPKPRVEAAVPD